MNQQSQSQDVQYFDLTTEGVGYLNRIRTVSPKKVTPYLACTINALCGPSDDVEYRNCDLIVVGTQAKAVVAQLEDAVIAQKKVIVGFRFGDASPNRYEVTNRETGAIEPRLCIKGRLLQITFAKIDGQPVEIPLVERRSADNDAADAGESTEAPETDESGVETASAEMCI